MPTRQVNMQRWSITSPKPFDVVVASVEEAIGRPRVRIHGAIELNAAIMTTNRCAWASVENPLMLEYHDCLPSNLYNFLDGPEPTGFYSTRTPMLKFQRMLKLRPEFKS
jgi:hypothetical protein